MIGAACPGMAYGEAFLTGMLTHVDCEAQTIGEAGYQALAAPGSVASSLLTAALVLFVAIQGYRLVLGALPGTRDAVVAAIKLGAVLVLATSWPAFRTVAYDVALRGPAELVAQIGDSAGLPGAGGGLVARLQAVDDQLARLAKLGVGREADPDQIAGPTQPLDAQGQRAELTRLRAASQRPGPDAAREAEVLGDARTLYLGGAVGAFAAVRLLAGLLLALGPVFALFLLFDATRGLFDGWVRALGGAALGGVGTGVVLSVELALLEPWLAGVLALREAGEPTTSVPIELLAATLTFALVLLAVLVASARIAWGFRLRFGGRGPAVSAAPPVADALPAASRDAAPASADMRGRAHGIADAVAATRRRETAAAAMGMAATASTAPGRSTIATASGSRVDPAAGDLVPLGRSYARRTRARPSLSAQRRDCRA